MKVTHEILVKLHFVEEAPERFERIKDPQEFAQDIMELIADEYSDVGTFAYDLEEVTQRINK